LILGKLAMPRWALFLLMFVSGVAAGLIYGWVIEPVQYTETSPASLRADYRTDYVLMIAETFHVEQDAALAVRRLSALGSEPPETIVLQALDFAQQGGYTQEDLSLLAALAQAVRLVTQGEAP
jgi:hypothetical protein